MLKVPARSTLRAIKVPNDSIFSCLHPESTWAEDDWKQHLTMEIMTNPIYGVAFKTESSKHQYVAKILRDAVIDYDCVLQAIANKCKRSIAVYSKCDGTMQLVEFEADPATAPICIEHDNTNFIKQTFAKLVPKATL